MKKIIFLIIAANIFFNSSKYYSQGIDTLRMKIDSIANVYLSNSENAGLVIGIIRKGTNPIDPPRKEIYYYGEVRKGSGISPDSLTIFKLGSVGKTFTATILAHYVVHDPVNVKLAFHIERYFQPGQPLPYWVPDLNPTDTFRISLVDLATHHSSIPAQPRNFVEPPNYTNEKLLEFLSSDKLSYEVRPLSHQPGTHWLYSNTGFGTLGYVLQRYSGMDFDTLEIKIFLDSLNMPDTRVNLNSEQRSRLAVGYENGDSVIYRLTSPGFYGAGGNFSTIRDMMNYLEWNMRLKNMQLNDLLDTLHLERKNSYNSHSWVGLAWQINYVRPGYETKYIWKDGGTAGFATFICFVDTSKTGVMVLSNSTNAVDFIGVNVLRLLNPVQKVDIKTISSSVPDGYSLSQNFPNPFNPKTIINFQILESNLVSLKVYNNIGKEVRTLVNEKLSAGSYELEFDASDFPSGVYFYKLKTGDFAQTKRMILLK